MICLLIGSFGSHYKESVCAEKLSWHFRRYQIRCTTESGHVIRTKRHDGARYKRLTPNLPPGASVALTTVSFLHGFVFTVDYSQNCILPLCSVAMTVMKVLQSTVHWKQYDKIIATGIWIIYTIIRVHKNYQNLFNFGPQIWFFLYLKNVN